MWTLIFKCIFTNKMMFVKQVCICGGDGEDAEDGGIGEDGFVVAYGGMHGGMPDVWCGVLRKRANIRGEGGSGGGG